ncbi:hypothetical protein KR51_00003120 [Rubidibacter lacunae KORDI 51-2]|uniref:Uncharacterized protein n=1 Tax=Rubidibacter lacunae KORDI 51-2 TaxID=582515 RepID=U5DMV2_9CHRO|nr:hypothetical protein [Rubidibacter lacunae]ERN43001.1 hypothetical protein KR51_00003120 [Rubidibacter lacunae KORDI 51-2]
MSEDGSRSCWVLRLATGVLLAGVLLAPTAARAQVDFRVQTGHRSRDYDRGYRYNRPRRAYESRGRLTVETPTITVELGGGELRRQRGRSYTPYRSTYHYDYHSDDCYFQHQYDCCHQRHYYRPRPSRRYSGRTYRYRIPVRQRY